MSTVPLRGGIDDAEPTFRRARGTSIRCKGDEPEERLRFLADEVDRLRAEIEILEGPVNAEIEMLAPPFVLCALEPGKLLDNRAHAMMEAMATASWMSRAFTSQPITAGLTIWQGQVLAFLLGCCGVAIGFLFISVAPNSSVQVATIARPVISSRSFRFTARELRDFTKQPNISSPGIKSFGLALDGVPVEERLTRNMTAISDGPNMFVAFPSRVDFNGWFIIASEEDPAKDAVAYELRCLLEGEEALVEDDWRIIGSDGWYWACGATIKTPTILRRNEDLPLCRGCRRVFDYSVRPIGVLVECGTWIGGGLCCLMGACAARMNLHRTGMFLIGCCFGLLTFQNVVFLAYEIRRRSTGEAIGAVIQIATRGSMFFVFCFGEQYFLRVVFIFGLGTILNLMFSMFVIGHEQTRLGAYFILPYLAGFLLTTGSVSFLYLALWNLKRKAWQLMTADMGAYGKVWDDLLNSDDVANVVKLESLCNSMADRTDDYRGAMYARQLNRCRVPVDDSASLIGIANANGRSAAPPDGEASPRSGLATAFAPVGPASPTPRAIEGSSVGVGSSDLVRRPARGEGSWVDAGPMTGLARSGPRSKIRKHLSLDSSSAGDIDLASSFSGRLTQGGNVHMHRTLLQHASRKSINTVAPLEDISVDSGQGSSKFFTDCHRLSNGSATSSNVVTCGEVLPTDWLVNYKPSHILGPEYLRYTTIVGTVDVKNPVTSLDQLFFQASGVSPLLRKHVLKWSAKSNALLPFLRPTPGGQLVVNTFESHEKATAGFVSSSSLESVGGVKWAKLKSPERAMEKVMRSYRGDVSRLLDICRQQIVFRSVQDLVSCLDAIAQDEDVRVVRVKNRMSRSFDATESVGYRDVMVNLRFVNERTSLYGIDTHVCEVQLLLLEFVKIKTEEGHKKYVKFRNLHGE